MGTWGTGDFENDAAQDWLSLAAQQETYSAFDELFCYRHAPYLEVDEGQSIVAAAAALLLLAEGRAQALPEDLQRWGAGVATPVASLLRTAESALTRVLATGSELLELWGESPSDLEQWTSHLQSMRSRLLSLASAAAPVAPTRTSPSKGRRTTPAVGQIVAVPLDEDLFALAQVLFLSSYFKNVALYGLLDARPSGNPALPKTLNYLTMKYGSSASIRRGEWPVVDSAPLAVDDNCSKRIVAGSVWMADQCLGSATEEDRQTLPNMDVYGNKALAAAFRRALS